MRFQMNLAVVAATVAASYFTTLDDASAAPNRRGGTASVSRSVGNRSAVVRSAPRQQTRSVNTGNGGRSAGRVVGSTNVGRQTTLRQTPRVTQQTVKRQAGATPIKSGGQTSILSPAQRSALGVNTQRPDTGASANNLQRPTVTSNGNALRSTAALPARLTVPAAGTKLGRIAPPLSLVPKATLAAPKLGFLSQRFRPFLQRHWRSAFFWIAIPTIGYLTIPEHCYDRFWSYVAGPEPDYDGAVHYLAQVAVAEDGGNVTRVTPARGTAIRYVAPNAPPTTFDARFQPFIDRQWNSAFATIAMPRIGNVTCPIAILAQVQPLLSGRAPRFADALALLEEAAAADTVVDEGALNAAPVAEAAR